MTRIRKGIVLEADSRIGLFQANTVLPSQLSLGKNKALIRHIVEEAIDSGIEDITVITSSKDINRSGRTFNSFNGAVIRCVEYGDYRNLNDAVCFARQFILDEPFALLTGDCIFHSEVKPCLQQLIEQYERLDASVAAVQYVPYQEVSYYSIVDSFELEERLFSICDLIAYPNLENLPSNLALTGRYIVKPEIFDILKDQSSGGDWNVFFIDALSELNRRQSLYAYNFETARYSHTTNRISKRDDSLEEKGGTPLICQGIL